MSTDRAQQSSGAPKSDTRLWIALLIFGAVGIFAGKLWRPGPLAEAYVEVVTETRVLAEVVPAPIAQGTSTNTQGSDPVAATGLEEESAPPARVWVELDDPRFKSGELRRVEGVAPEVWDERSKVDPKKAREQIVALESDAEKLSAPTDPTGLTREEFEAREAARMNALKVVESTRIVPSPRDSIGIWVAALLTLGIFSFLVRDNPFYKVVESILIGVSAAYWMLVAFWSTLVPDLFAKLAPDLIRATLLPGLAPSEHPGKDFLLALIPLALGVMLLWRLAPRGAWIAVWPLAVVIGTFAGMRLTASIEADFMAQIAATMKPLVAYTSTSAEGAAASAATSGGAFDLGGTLAGILGVVGVMTVLVYFFFSLEHKGVVGKTARVGVWFLMITFGAAFGFTVMGRITLLVGRFDFLFNDWLGLSP
jgi:hypothetical protein